MHLPPILGCSYQLHSSHRFLSTWGVVMLVKNKQTKKNEQFLKYYQVRGSNICGLCSPLATVIPCTMQTCSLKSKNSTYCLLWDSITVCMM